MSAAVPEGVGEAAGEGVGDRFVADGPAFGNQDAVPGPAAPAREASPPGALTVTAAEAAPVGVAVAGAGGVLLDFAPVPVAQRHDGWTPERQRAFIEALADSGSVAVAAKSVGMRVESAYRLRRRADAGDFAAAWDAAYGALTKRLTDAAFARAIHGVSTPVFYQGEVIGERTSYDERLTRFLLEKHDPRGHGMLQGTDPGWAAKRDTLAPRLARLPRLLTRLFGQDDDPVARAEEDEAGEAAKALPARRRAARHR